MKTLMTAVAFAAAATAISTPAAFAVTGLDSQLEKSVYNDIRAFDLDDVVSVDQIAALSTNDLILIENILADEDKLEVSEVNNPFVEQRIRDIVAR